MRQQGEKTGRCPWYGVQSLEGRVLLSTGAPDSSFGTGGRTLAAFQGSADDLGQTVVVQGDGKVIVAGGSTANYQDVSLAAVSQQRFAVTRYNPNGTLDTTFGTGGRDILPIRSNATAFAVALQTDGKIVLVGNAASNTGFATDFATVRLNPDGTADTSFNGTGVVTIHLGGVNDSADAYSVAIQSDGRIVAAGDYAVWGRQAASSALMRLNTNGALDPTFGIGGMVVDSSNGNGSLRAVAIDGNGKIVVTGRYFDLSRYNADGTLDTTFGTGGADVEPLGSFNPSQANALAFTSDGKIIAAGSQNYVSEYPQKIAIARFTLTGQLDTTFGSGGSEYLNPTGGTFVGTNSIALTPSNQIFLAGRSDSSTLLLRLTPSGLLDSTYTQSGMASPVAGTLAGMSLRADGSVIAAGSMSSVNTYDDFLALSFTASGILNTAFAGAGWTKTDFTGQVSAQGQAVVVQSDKKVIVGGTAVGQGTGEDFVLARFNTDGTLDSAFGNNGIVSTDFSGTNDVLRGLALQINGDIVAVGSTNVGLNPPQPNGVVIRYLPSGQLDPSFGSAGKVVLPSFASGYYSNGDALAIQSDGKIVIAADSFNQNLSVQLGMARLTSSGALDSSFNGTGTLMMSDQQVTPAAVAIDSGGRILVDGGTSAPVMIGRFTSSGSPDTSFGGSGLVFTSFQSIFQVNTLAIEADGKLIAAGTANDGNSFGFALLRYNSNGTLDATYGTNGVLFSQIGATVRSGRALLALSDGSVVIAGTGSSAAVLSHYDVNGTLDTNFGASGLDSLSFGDPFVSISGIAIAPDGAIVIAGQDCTLSTPYQLAAVRLTTLALDTIPGTSGTDRITLTQTADHQHVNWTMGVYNGQLPINDPSGLTINGNGGNDTITLVSTNGNPLPNLLNLNGVFTINGLTGTNPLAGINLEIGRSTVYISYSSSDPLALIQGYLRNGYNNGAWNGTPTASTGVITSIPAASNAAQTTAIAYADSADGLIPGQPANTIELKYTLYGDTTLGGTVGPSDFTRLHQHYNRTTGGTWDSGDFNYDGSINFNDFTLLTRNYNTSLGSQAAPSVQASSITTNLITSSVANSGKQSLSVQTKPDASASSHHHKSVAKHPKKHRR